MATRPGSLRAALPSNATLSRDVIDGNFEASTAPNVVRVTSADSPFTPELTDELVLCDATGGAITVALQPLADALGRRICIKKTDSSGNAVTIDGDGSEQVEQSGGTLSTTRSLASQGSKADLVADTAWFEV